MIYLNKNDFSDDDDSSEEKQDIQLNNKNNSKKENCINIEFRTSTGFKVLMNYNSNEIVGYALKKYLKKIGLNPNDNRINFLYNAYIINFDENKTVGEFFKKSNYSIITIIDTLNIIGS